MTEPLINIVPKNDFERLLFAQNYIKYLKAELSELKFKLGELISEKDELIYNNNKLIKDKSLIKEFRREDYVKNILNENQSLRRKNSKLRQSNNDLVNKLVILQNK